MDWNLVIVGALIGAGVGYARKNMAAAEAVADIENENKTIVLPACESQVRPLTKLPQDERASAWREAVEAAPNGKPTAVWAALAESNQFEAIGTT